MGKKRKDKQGGKDLPELFFERLTAIVGPSLSSEIRKTFIERPTTFRVNTLKAKKQDVKKILIDLGFQLRDVPWYTDAFILLNKSKRELTDLPLYIEGKIYVQSLASMVPPLVLEPNAGEKVLDLTAAPGSKTSQIAAMMEQQGLLVANDIDSVRFFKLKHNMELLGVLNEKEGWTCTLRMEPGWKLCSEYPEGYFDKILLDAPCSAEARFVEGDPRTYGYWSERKIKDMVSTQWRLLLAAWYALKPGGTLVYSTCTFAPEENEYQMTKFLERVGNATLCDVEIAGLKRLPIVQSWKEKPVNIDTKKCLRVYPTKEIEGFFVAKIEKKI
ncbi:MAG TPA: RsmB/NOP family class I SAM-dependent RNA methyltransferase [Candidatus Kapabacteria bacterium]|nr:RsmB/NOP family class I SAM-dependent RNA methyltransferase [Candidatus Kapabacteria bacterium]